MKKIFFILFLFVSLLSKGQDFIEWISGQGSNCKEYGLLYNYPAATDPNITSGGGWIVPDTADYRELADYIGAGGDYVSNSVGGLLKKTGLDYWVEPNLGAANTFNFNGVGGGSRLGDGSFDLINENGFHWTTDTVLEDGYVVILESESEIFKCNDWSTPLNVGNSIRLVRPTTESEQLLDDGTFVDDYVGNDSTEYQAVKIGNQIWLAKNLYETKLRTGSIIPFHGLDNDSTFTDLEWSELTTAGVCAYDNDLNNVACGFEWPFEVKYGYLYNWYVTTDSRDISSSDDWIVPDSTNLKTLLDYIDNYNSIDEQWDSAGTYLKESDTIYWAYVFGTDTIIEGTNDYNFNLRGAGVRRDDGSFDAIRLLSYVTSPTIIETDVSNYHLFFVHSRAYVNKSDNPFVYGMSIRLVRPATESEQLLDDGTYVDDYVGNNLYIYRTVKIGTQIWLADNLAETKYRNGDWIDGYNGGVYTPISNEDWAAKTTGAMCAYDDDETNAINQ